MSPREVQVCAGQEVGVFTGPLENGVIPAQRAHYLCAEEIRILCITAVHLDFFFVQLL